MIRDNHSSPLLLVLVLPHGEDHPPLLLLPGLGGDQDEVTESLQETSILLINKNLGVNSGFELTNLIK